MKKFLPYLLILVFALAIAGIFTPTTNVQGAGICIDPLTTTPQAPTTKGSCEAEGWNWEEGSIDTDRPASGSYHLLEKLPTVPETFDTGQPGALAKYLNPMITLFIGLCAVAAVVMITIGGIEYSTAELVSNKAAAKERIQNALLGLLLALCSWLILNTINPDLLITDTEIAGVDLAVDYEPIKLVDGNIITSAAQTFNGAPGRINFKRDACPAAFAAAARYGLDPALVLAIFDQETGSGRNHGRCTANNGSNIHPNQLPALRVIANRFYGGNINAVPMSCDPGEGRGGAIGLMQFLPATWIQHGGTGNPWSINDSMMAAASHLRTGGAPGNIRLAACRYIAGNGVSGCSSQASTYANSVLAKMEAYKRKIAAGECAA